ncbi:ABC transporter permease [Simplicispira psychrophila]|uniref:ABC transporter permease n=1 Tax=Simplicispira psychrophila TaxID=80882 RepID=UPI0004849303|nr:ABC transporter permease [Simplicispira psychrophila]
MWDLLRLWSVQELRHHPWRSTAAVFAVVLGVALAFAVHTINASALGEFAQALRSVSGQPDLQLRAAQGSLDEALFARLATHPQVAHASPILDISVLALPAPAAGNDATTSDTAGTPAIPIALRLIGADALLLPRMAPDLMPRPFASLEPDRLVLFAPATVFLNAAAQQALGLGDTPSQAPQLLLQVGLQRLQVRVAGSVAASGAPLAVMDIGAAQDLLGRIGELSRIDVQLRPGTVPSPFRQSLQDAPDWPAGLIWSEPGDAAQSVHQLSRAYRVNLTVLALVALFTGAYLVFSVLALSVTQRAPQFALLAVLGATPRQRLLLVLTESLVLGLVGSASGIALGTALAAGALQLLGGDLGGGYFSGTQPALQFSTTAALIYGALGTGAALLGGWWPARTAQALPAAQTLKSLGLSDTRQPSGRWGMILIAISAGLVYVPPIFSIPLAAYVAIGLGLVGGIALLPWGVALLLRALRPLVQQRLLPLLALERARRARGTAAVAVGGVVASLSLAVALTVMVGSFRGSVMDWLDAVLPAPLYVRSAGARSGDTPAFSAALVQRIAQLDGVERVQGARYVPLLLAPTRPSLVLIARLLTNDPARTLPLVAPALPVPAGRIGIYVSEAVVDLWKVAPGENFAAFSESFRPLAHTNHALVASFFIAGVWRDYARQSGTVVMDAADYTRLTGDDRANDLSLWPRQGTDLAALEHAISTLVAPGVSETSAQGLLEFTAAQTIRTRSLQIFDRSFAVTYWLQAVAIGIGLFGVAASFSAQVLARRKEFGLLAHLGLTRRQILTVVAGEGVAWTTVGALAGVLLGLAVSVVLVHVVNPQSFHWTMDLRVPWERLLALALAVVVAGTATAWLAGRAAAGQQAVLAVKEDW